MPVSLSQHEIDRFELNRIRESYRQLFLAIKQTLNENLHLCDGDNCTLKVLRDEYLKQGGELE